MKVIVCGGRNYDKRREFFREMDRLHQEMGPFTEVVCGGYRGADTLASNWSVERLRRQATTFNVRPEEWADIKSPGAKVKTLPNGRKYNAAAGPRRNQRMLLESKANVVIAFPGGEGTADMMARADRCGALVIQVGSWPKELVRYQTR